MDERRIVSDPDQLALPVDTSHRDAAGRQSTTPAKKLAPKKTVKPKPAVELADELPVAQVVIDSPLPHLDRLFDYSVPQKLADQAQPGVRVRVRFAGKLIDGFILSRSTSSQHEGALTPLAAVVSPEVVLLPEISRLAEDVAQRYAGVLSDVLRAAIPNRHARAESTSSFVPSSPLPDFVPQLWSEYSGGTALITRTIEHQMPRAIVSTGNDDPAALIAEYAHACAASNNPILVVVPDRAAVERVVAALGKRDLPESSWTTLNADDGPEIRYRNWLKVLRQEVAIVVGTRAASFAPLAGVRALCIWDDNDESLVDPQAPYWHARDVLVMRSSAQQAALVIIGATISTDAAALIPWAAHVARPRDVQRTLAPRVRCAQDDVYQQRESGGVPVRLPGIAMQAAREGLKLGPVLFLVARAGYQPRLVCDKCRNLLECSQCGGPVVRTARTSAPTCTHCGHLHIDWSCAHCQGTVVRAPTVGSERTAEELGRAFPGIPVRTSSGDRIVRSLTHAPSIVVATPGAVPVAEGGYQCVVLLDGNIMLGRPDLRAAEDTYMRWMEAAWQVPPGGEVIVVAEPEHPAVQALIRHDPLGFAQRECEVRAQVSLPPAVRLVQLTGSQIDIDDFMEILNSMDIMFEPNQVMVRGPVPLDDGQMRLLLSTTKAQGLALAQAVKATTVIRSTKHRGNPVNVKVDPRRI